MRRVHLVVGLAAIVAFVASGQYMDLRHGHLRGMADGPRLLFRSAHIYLLFAALLNTALGLYAEPAPRGWRRAVQWAGSALVAAAPALLALAFLREPWLADLERPYARPAIYGSLAGVLLHLASRFGLAREAGRAG
jgi:hypothetical protein